VRRFIFAWMAVSGIILFVQRLCTPTTVSFEMAVREAPARNGLLPCIYYDTGSGFSEAERRCLDYYHHPLNDFQPYQVTLPTLRTIRQLRLDPLQQPGMVALRNVSIGRYRFVKVDLAHELGHTIYPLNGVVLSLQDNTLVAQLSTDDPYMMLSDRLDRLTGLEAEVVFRAAALAFLLCAGCVLGIVLLRTRMGFPSGRRAVPVK
jgi:hypothetical protein